MLKEAIGTGATVEEAKEQAVAILGAGIEDSIEIEVLAMPKRKTLGLFGGSLAKVRVSMEVPDPKPAPAPKKPQASKPPVGKQQPKQQPVRQNQTAPKAPPKQAAQQTAQKPEAAKKAESRQPAPKKPLANNAVPQKKPERPAESKSEPVRTLGPAVPAAEVDPNTAPGRAVAYLQRLFKIMELEGVEMTVSPIDGGSQVDLTGESLGVIIGRRGETLDALQYLASLAANSGDGGFYRLVLNTGNYRQKREQTLQSLARRMAAQVVRTGRNRTLEPMNPYERRIIHTTVQSIDGVVSNSIGDGSSRRVVISPDRENGAAPVRREPQNRGGVAAKNERPGFWGYREDTAETELKNLNEEKAEGVPAPIPAAAPQTEAAPAPQKTRSEIEAFEALAAGKSVILPENAAPAPVKKEEPAPAPVKKDADAAPLYGRIDTKSE